MKHWHSAFGIPGYGPDGGDNMFLTATQIHNGLDTLIRDQLTEAAEIVGHYASACSDAADIARESDDDGTELRELRDYQSAIKLLDEIDTKQHNFNPARAEAPLYRDNPQAWEETVIRMVRETFPMDITHNTRLYVWECEFPHECQHITFRCKHCPRDVSRDGDGGWIDDGHKSLCHDGTAHEGDTENPS